MLGVLPGSGVELCRALVDGAPAGAPERVSAPGSAGASSVNGSRTSAAPADISPADAAPAGVIPVDAAPDVATAAAPAADSAAASAAAAASEAAWAADAATESASATVLVAAPAPSLVFGVSVRVLYLQLLFAYVRSPVQRAELSILGLSCR
ncbi:hypothetical protein GCM10009563_05130 [Subtercola frigoramans]